MAGPSKIIGGAAESGAEATEGSTRESLAAAAKKKKEQEDATVAIAPTAAPTPEPKPGGGENEGDKEKEKQQEQQEQEKKPGKEKKKEDEKSKGTGSVTMDGMDEIAERVKGFKERNFGESADNEDTTGKTLGGTADQGLSQNPETTAANQEGEVPGTEAQRSGIEMIDMQPMPDTSPATLAAAAEPDEAKASDQSDVPKNAFKDLMEEIGGSKELQAAEAKADASSAETPGLDHGGRSDTPTPA
jgi:hypothetical protein